MDPLIYVASPYTHADESIREENFRRVSRYVSHLVSKGNVAISPITYGHTLLNYEKMPSDWQFWMNFCLSLLVKCDRMIVYMMPGWENSKGVQDEISFARDHNIPVDFAAYMDDFLVPKSRKLKKSHKNLRMEETVFIYCHIHKIDKNFNDFIDDIFMKSEFDNHIEEFDKIHTDIRLKSASEDYTLNAITEDDWNLILNKFS